jgi:aspartyl-tRNA(Asn)/glutamyl-tRNA(Gln) amidotransferase subunit A
MPAAFCGVMGLKPTYGRVSRCGLIAYASSFDSIGPMGHHLEDLNLVLACIEGQDGYDSTLSDAPERAYQPKKRVAYIKEIVEHPSLQPEIRKAFFEQIESLQLAGIEVVGVDFPYIDQMLPTYYVLTTAEASSNLARFDGVKFGHRTENPKDLMDMYKKTREEGFGEEVKRRIMLGTFVLSADYYDAYYTKAQQVRRLIQERTLAILADVDYIISPTTSSTAYVLGEKTVDPLQMYLGDLFTVQANVTGLPAISIPMGTATNQLPMGFQFMGRAFDEAGLLNIAKLIQV